MVTYIYHLTVWTKPIDWADSAQKQSIGFYKTEVGAKAKIKELEKDKDYGIYYGDPQVCVIELKD